MKKFMTLLTAGLILTGFSACAKDTIINSRGNVGIGATLPEGLPEMESKGLHIVHQAAPAGKTLAGLRLEIEGIIDGGITNAYNADNADAGLYVGTLSNHRLTLGTSSTGRLTITPEGNIGIGTYKALQPLHVQGNAYILDKLGVGVDSPTNNLQVSGSDALFSSDTGDFNVFVSKKLDTDNGSLIFQQNYEGRVQLGLVSDNNFHLQVSSDGNIYTDAMFVSHENGHISIGSKETNTARFTVDDTDGGTAFKTVSYKGGYSLVARKDGDGGAVFINKMDDTKGNSLRIIHNGPDSAMVIGNATSDLMVVKSSGNVGIGTANPKGTLDVNGPIYQRGKALNADYVFEPDYRLESVREHADFMWSNKHLKAIPKAVRDDSGEEIVEIGSHYKGIVEELEKAHIYIEQLHNQLEEQNRKMLLLEERLQKMESGS